VGYPNVTRLHCGLPNFRGTTIKLFAALLVIVEAFGEEEEVKYLNLFFGSIFFAHELTETEQNTSEH
jgi:hypothetical protein